MITPEKARPIKWLRNMLIVFLLAFILTILFITQVYRVRSHIDLPEAWGDTLTALASTALGTGDVPVGAILVYKGEIIGSGFNTVRRDMNMSGHAEINALNDAVGHLGRESFSRLDRNELVVYSTFEPCEMCRGTLNHYGIYKCNFMKGKSWMTWFRSSLRDIRYELFKRRSGDAAIQDSLFHLHPEYPGR